MGRPNIQRHNAFEGTVRHMVRARTEGRRSVVRTLGAAAATAVLVLAAAACGNGGGGYGGGSPRPSPTGTESPGPTARSSAPQDRARAEAEVTGNWEKFFDPGTSLKDKAALLENGDKLRPLLQGFANDPRAGQVRAAVGSVTFTSATEADVTYTLTLKEQPVLPDASGTSVLQDGTWKVSVATLCALVSMDTGNGASKTPGC